MQTNYVLRGCVSCSGLQPILKLQYAAVLTQSLCTGQE